MTADSDVDRLPFRVKARLISEIGDELVSSDPIALYELIKNSFDANAGYVRVEIKTPTEFSEVREALDGLTEANAAARIARLGDVLTDRAARGHAVSLAEAGEIDAAGEVIRSAFRAASEMTVTDNGEGMSRQRLIEGFLSLATSLRFVEQRARSSGRPILGSKGVGRFSAKRLGRELVVETRSADSPWLEHLRIDWSQYAPESDLYLDQVNNDLWHRRATSDRRAGTQLVIRDLAREWTRDDLEDVARSHLSTLMNPFFTTDFKVLLRFNGKRVDLHALQEDLLDLARLKIRGTFDPTLDHPLTLEFTRGDTGATETVIPDREAFAGFGDLHPLGPFRFAWYDFLRNDARIRALGRSTELDRFLSDWGGGGPLLFRDGFRVMPYGRPGYDWLEIDRELYRAGGTRLRTLAFSGFVEITAAQNPGLLDQTNREGLRSTHEFKQFVDVLKYAIQRVNLQLRTYWPPADRRTPVVPARRAAAAREAVDALVDEALDLAESTQDRADSEDVRGLAHALIDKIVAVRTAAHAYVALANDRRDHIPVHSYPALLELAGLGMAAEQLSHELLAAIDRAEAVITRLRRVQTGPSRVLLEQLSVNFAALRRTAGFLLPLTQASRRVRGEYDVVEEAISVGRHYPAIAEGRVALTNGSPDRPLIARVNRGVLLQVFDNLIANSIYWMGAARTERQEITVRSDVASLVRYRDTGPGIEPRLSDVVFEPFQSTKPNGRGLGLFIARELLELDRCRIYLADPDEDGRLREFVLDFTKVAKR